MLLLSPDDSGFKQVMDGSAWPAINAPAKVAVRSDVCSV